MLRVTRLNSRPGRTRRAPGTGYTVTYTALSYVGRSSRSSGNFQPSLNGRSARQTASTRVGELSIRYMRPFTTSPTDIYSYGTTVHMSILSQPIMRSVQIMRTSRVARSTGSQCHHAHSTDPCRARTVENGNASNHANPMHTARMRAAGSWAARAARSRYAGTSAHRASSSAKHDMQLITHVARNPLKPGIAAER